MSARVCRTCGHVGCCDSSPKRHAREHFKKTGHAILSDLNDSWRWCYQCNDYVKN
ncbi:UBP-type zinc finger domain-containing protein [Candidatus Micrarchaeota archaeon]|nr:UBP-type zinc finger domain-containing protein [Candidatus Micrarchaeota archaeon]